MRSKIYTRKGDSGETSLYAGPRVMKCDPLLEAIGTVDEANSVLGGAISLLRKHACAMLLISQLEQIQRDLFDVGAFLATPPEFATERKIQKTLFDFSKIETLESWIDALEEKLPPLKAFILPGGSKTGAQLHVARTVVRRAERNMVAACSPDQRKENPVLQYLNRLSDYLFVVARYVNFQFEIPESLWHS